MNLKIEITSFLADTGMSRNALAKRAGVSHNSISRLISGERKGVHSTTADKIREAMAEYKESLGS